MARFQEVLRKGKAMKLEWRKDDYEIRSSYETHPGRTVNSGYISTHYGDSGNPIWIYEKETGKTPPTTKTEPWEEKGRAVLVSIVQQQTAFGMEKINKGEMIEDKDVCLMVATKITEDLLNWIKIAAGITRKRKHEHVRNERRKINKLRGHILKVQNNIKLIRW